MADVIPAFRIGGTQALVIFLYVTVVFGSLHLFAINYPSNKVAKAWLAMGF